MRNKKKSIFSKFFSKYFIRSKAEELLTYHSLNSNINNLTTSIYQLDPHRYINYIKNNKFISRNFNDLYNSENGILLTFDMVIKTFKKGMEKY